MLSVLFLILDAPSQLKSNNLTNIIYPTIFSISSILVLIKLIYILTLNLTDLPAGSSLWLQLFMKSKFFDEIKKKSDKNLKS